MDGMGAAMSGDDERSQQPYEPPPDHVNWFNHKLAQWPEFWAGHGYGSVPDLTGLRVLDIGCGLGGYAVSAVMAGAEVVGIDVDGPSLRFARHTLHDRFPELAPRLQVLQMAIEDYHDDSGFDYVITQETFEHILALGPALTGLARLLRPQGTLLASWGPWTSALSGHDLQFYLEWMRGPPWWKPLRTRITTDSRTVDTLFRIPIPFSHRLFTNQALQQYGRRNPGKAHGTIQDVVSMNGLSIPDYVRIIADSPFEIQRWKTNVGKHPGYILLRLLSRIPGLTDAFTHNIYATLALSDQVPSGVDEED